MEANEEQQGYSRYRKGLEIGEGIGGTSKIEALRGSSEKGWQPHHRNTRVAGPPVHLTSRWTVNDKEQHLGGGVPGRLSTRLVWLPCPTSPV